MKECNVEDWEKNTKNLNLDRARIHDKLVSIIRDTLQSGKILEIGAQTGMDAEFLANLGYDVTAIDYNNEAIKLIKDRKKVKIAMADAIKLPFHDSSFDLVYSQGLIEHFRELESSTLIEEQKRITKLGGHMIIDVPNLYSLNTLPKQILILMDKWIVPWETQYSRKGLKHLGESNGLKLVQSYSWGYDKFIGEKVKSALTIIMDGYLEKLEASKGQYFMKCIGAVFQKV